ncbi:MAG: hypothetical protein ACOC2K_04765, partial [Bacteroidota bacterium]
MQKYPVTILNIILLFALGCMPAMSNNKDNKQNKDYYLYAAMLDPAETQQDTETAADDEGILSNQQIRIINLGPVVNHEGYDYAPTVSADGRTLYFVSNREGSKLLKGDGDPSHDFWATTKEHRLDTVFTQPYNIDKVEEKNEIGVNTIYNEGAASIAADGQSLYFTGCNRPDGLGQCDIYSSRIEGDKWSRPFNLGRNVNSKNFDSQPSIAPDKSRIYFVSTREGPNSDGDEEYSNFDIWYSDWDYDMEEWKPAKNLEAINTSGQEASPFIAADNQTLFFASNNHEPNYGGLDFYVTRYDPVTDSWSKPQNIGKPINTNEDEQFITLPASGDIIYFSSTRQDYSGYQGSLDLFMAFVPTFFRAVQIVGTVEDECTGEYIPAAIEIKNPVTGRIVRDTLTMDYREFEIIVTNDAYGDPRDSIMFIDFEITATNPKYGSKSIIQRVEKPELTQKEEEAESVADVINVKVTLGNRPVVETQIAEADYISRTKADNPELAGYSGLVMEEVKTWDLYPLLNYIFFEKGSSEIPDRYILFDSPQQATMFADTTIPGGTLNKYYHVLNIYGFRMNQFPDAEIEIVGCNDGRTTEEKEPGLSKSRAEEVFNYFKNIWGISEDRMKLIIRNEPKVPSNPRDSLGIRENRRVEILCDDWEIMKPVFDKDPTIFPQPETMQFVMDNGIEDAIIASRRIEIKRGTQEWNTLTDIGLTDKNY